MIKFSEYMKLNDIDIKIYSGYKYFIKLVIKNNINTK
jgi:hypothetical protein